MKYIDGSVHINSLSLKEIPEILNGVHVKGDFIMEKLKILFLCQLEPF